MTSETMRKVFTKHGVPMDFIQGTILQSRISNTPNLPIFVSIESSGDRCDGLICFYLLSPWLFTGHAVEREMSWPSELRNLMNDEGLVDSTSFGVYSIPLRPFPRQDRA